MATKSNMDLYAALRPFLFRLSAEKAHELTFAAMQMGNGAFFRALGPSYSHKPEAAVALLGLPFKNRVGLAAGLDKNALCLPAWAQLGFGHVEIGTVTPKPQAGNPKPRLYRLVEDRALLNRMGFNNDGADVIRQRLENRPLTEELILGGNIGKNKDTPEADAYRDYLYCLNALHEYVDYITLNVSSPNTPGLRQLQSKEPLLKLLSEVQNRNQALTSPKPIFLKIAPDLATADLEDIAALAIQCQISGLIATNTTVSHEGLMTSADKLSQLGSGGISGSPLTNRSNEFCTRLRGLIPSSMVLISSGGIMSAQDVQARRTAGADLVQLYTGLVYAGPGLVPAAIAAAQ
jgi:dihydroorotate dehydrogenase